MTYVYFCEKHGEFEYSHSIKEKLETCPFCIEEGIIPPNFVKRLIVSENGFILLGGSWSKDNYK